MKHRKLIKALFVSALCWVAFGVNAEPTKKKVIETTFEVRGACGMCETKIEEGVMLLNGVKLADWDRYKQEIVVVYNSKKISENEIHQAIALLGYDTNLVKATDKNYGDLPGCCKYREGQKVH